MSHLLAGPSVGYFPRIYSRIDQAMNAAGVRGAFAFVMEENHALNKVTFYISAKIGSIVAADLEAQLWSASASDGKPDTNLETIGAADADPVAFARIAFSGFTTALVADTRYWIVVRNKNADPANNHIYLVCLHSASIPQATGGHADGQGQTAWDKMTSADGGATWNFTVSGAAGMRLEYSSGEVGGLPFDDILTDGTKLVYATREVGLDFTNTMGVTLRVQGISMTIIRAGAPSVVALYKLRLRSDLSLLGVTPGRVVPVAGAFDTVVGRFTTPLLIAPNQTYRLTLAEPANADAAGNNYQVPYNTFQTDALTKSLLPFAGSCEAVYYDGAAWAVTQGRFPPFALILDGSQPIQAGGGAGRGTLRGM